MLAALELAILGALDQLLDLVNFTLVALHPELASEPSLRHPRDPQAALAEAIAEHSAHLASAMIAVAPLCSPRSTVPIRTTTCLSERPVLVLSRLASER